MTSIRMNAPNGLGGIQGIRWLISQNMSGRWADPAVNWWTPQVIGLKLEQVDSYITKRYSRGLAIDSQARGLRQALENVWIKKDNS